MVIFMFQSKDLFWNKNILMGVICFAVQKTFPDLQVSRYAGFGFSF